MDEKCERCGKREALCVCSRIVPLQTRHHVLMLQHPQEPDKVLGSARLAHLALPNSSLRVGLSWPNLAAALGRDVSPGKWVALYLGSGAKEGKPTRPLTLLTKKGAVVEDQDEVMDKLEGLIVLDGTWSQAKALWWRNAWLLKCRRGILVPPKKSMYAELRREPRGECLSTIESVALALDGMGETPAVKTGLEALFAALLERVRAQRR